MAKHDQIVQGCPGSRWFSAADGIEPLLEVSWSCAGDEVLVGFFYRDTGQRHECTLRLDNGSRRCSFIRQGDGCNQRVSVELHEGKVETVLHGDLPLTQSSWFCGAVARFVLHETPCPPPCPVPLPRPGPHPGGPDQRAGTIIENPRLASRDVFCFLWLRAPELPCFDRLGQARLADADALPLVRALAAARPDGRRAQGLVARAFAGTPAFVRAIDSLDEPVTRYDVLRSEINAIEGVVPIEDLLLLVDTFVEGFGFGGLQDYLESNYLADVEGRVWQSLLAFSFGEQPDAALGDRLVATLQMGHFLRLLATELDTDDEPLLRERRNRDRALGATVVLPTRATPSELGSTTPGYGHGRDGWARALGIGDLKIVRQCLSGYTLGEVADTVNVMGRERLRSSDRALERTTETIERGIDHRDSQADASDTESRFELRGEVDDLIAAESLCSNYNNLSQDYGMNGTSVTLNGTWSGNECVKERTDREANRFAQGLVARATKRVVAAVTERQTRQHLAEREVVDARDVDNRDGECNLLGVYRWLQKIYQLSVVEVGQRLIVEIAVPRPAASYRRALRREGGVVLTPPPTLSSEGVRGPEDVTEDNYQFLASLYGVDDLPVPPAETIELSAAFQSQPPVTDGELAVPPGYEVVEGTVSYLLGDEADSLVGFVGDAGFTVKGSPAAAGSSGGGGAASDSAAGDGTDGGDDTACPACPDPFAHEPAAETPVGGSQALKGLAGVTGTIPIAVLATTTSFHVAVRVSASSPAGDALYEAWQVQVFDALTAGFGQRLTAYKERLDARLPSTPAARRVVEHRALKEGSIDVLWSLEAAPPLDSPPSPPDSPCVTDHADVRAFFERAFEWPELTYAFPRRRELLEPCGPDPCWRGEAVVDADPLFDSFLHAAWARVLVPVRPGAEAAVLTYLRFGRVWPGSFEDIPLAAADLARRCPPDEPETCEPSVARCWEVEIPTDLTVLQASSDLPSFACPPPDACPVIEPGETKALAPHRRSRETGDA